MLKYGKILLNNESYHFFPSDTLGRVKLGLGFIEEI